MSNYQVGGSLPADAPSYVNRQCDRDLLQALRSGEFCYVLNSRQMGKSSLRVRTMQKLQVAGYRCATLDISEVGNRHVTPEQWYAGIAYVLASRLNLVKQLNVRTWWKSYDFLSPVLRLGQFFDEILKIEPTAPTVIFIDEIDSVLSLDFPTDEFFGLLRICYNRRADRSAYQRLTFTLLGVAAPSMLIHDRSWNPFNIGKGIPLGGFQLKDAYHVLAPGLRGKSNAPHVLLREVLKWTGGHPFLTQKLCKLIQSEPVIPANSEAVWVERLVNKYIVNNWEYQDEPPHLKPIRDRLLRNKDQINRILGCYQTVLQGKPLAREDSRERLELRLSGLITPIDGKLQVSNRIYASVFNQAWLNEVLASQRPYGSALLAWQESQQDETHLLRDEELEAAQRWAEDNQEQLNENDRQFLGASLNYQITTEAEAEADRILLAANRRAKQIVAWAIVVLIVSAILGILSIHL